LPGALFRLTINDFGVEFQGGKKMSHRERSQEMQTCIDNCQDCHAACIETISHCLEMGGDHASPEHIRLLQDCVQICMTSADFMLRASDYHPQVCGVCADICDACANECERMSEGSDFMQRCAEACRRCAESCRRMSRMSTTVSA
jgi:hypothetical protein